jgi:hypothetical protein
MENSDIIFVGGDRGLIEGVLKGLDVGWSHFWVLGQVLKVLKSCEAPLWADREARMVLWRRRLSDEQQGHELVI